MDKKILLMSCLSTSCFATESIYFNVRADAYSEPLAIHAFINDWDDASFKAGEKAFAHGKMRLGVRQGQWDTSWVWMYDYTLDFSKDLSRLYYQIKNDQQITANEQYDLYINAQHVDAVGARFAYQWQLNDEWSVTTGFTPLIGRHFINGQVNALGQTTAQEPLLDRVEWLNGFIDYSYDQPALKEDKMGWAGKTNQGYGYALDLILQGRIDDHWYLKLNIEDVFGYLYWNEAPFTKYNIQYHQDNRPRFDIQGQFDVNQTFVQKLPYKIYGDFYFQPPEQPWQLGVSTLSNSYLTLWQLNASWLYKDDIKLSTHIELQTQSVGVSVQHKNFALKYMADDFDSSNARRMSALISAHYTCNF